MNLPGVVTRIMRHIPRGGGVRSMGCVSMGMFRILTGARGIYLLTSELLDVLAAKSEWGVIARCRCKKNGSKSMFWKAYRDSNSADAYMAALRIAGQGDHIRMDQYGTRDMIRSAIMKYPTKIAGLNPVLCKAIVRDFCKVGDSEILKILYDCGLTDGAPIDMYILTNHLDDFKVRTNYPMINRNLLLIPEVIQWMKCNTHVSYYMTYITSLTPEIEEAWDSAGVKWRK